MANSATRRLSVTQRPDGSFDMACLDCGGYGGHWTRRLMPFDAGWSIPPEETDDGIGYAMCLCMAGPDSGSSREVDNDPSLGQPGH